MPTLLHRSESEFAFRDSKSSSSGLRKMCLRQYAKKECVGDRCLHIIILSYMEHKIGWDVITSGCVSNIVLVSLNIIDVAVGDTDIVGV